MVTLPPIPARIAALPRDDRGYPVPWFVAWIDGKPEFRCADGQKLAAAIKEHRCWVCGEKLGRNLAFVIGPMCAINRTTAEPPCHLECAEFSAKACPFLSMPKAQRREANLPEGSGEAAGIAIKRNPGVTLIWVCRKYSIHVVGDGVLFKIGQPSQTKCYCEGRAATYEEVNHSVETGLPILREMAEQEGPDAVVELNCAIESASRFLPPQHPAVA
jgi:hypothetical protein